MQRKYAFEIISEDGLTRAKPIAIPMEPNHKLAKSTSPLFHMPDMYRLLSSKLIYLTLTRPKLAYTMHILHNSCTALGVIIGMLLSVLFII